MYTLVQLECSLDQSPSAMPCSTMADSTATSIMRLPLHVGLGMGTTSRARDSRREIALDIDCFGAQSCCVTDGSSGMSAEESPSSLDANESALPLAGWWRVSSW